MKKIITALIFGLFYSIAVADNTSYTESDHAASAKLFDAKGQAIGKVYLQQRKNKVNIEIRVSGLTSGFHGFHIHTTGLCDNTTVKPYTSAGGHFNLAEGATHRNHSGDLPTLLANNQGKAKMEFSTDRFKLNDLFDIDGSAVIIHADPDNYANIPSDRYSPAPDATTLATGDAGARVACGIIKPSNSN